MITESELKQRAAFFAKYLWDRELDIPVRVNKRLRSTLGWYMVSAIEISPRILHDDLLTDDTLLHELCHWYCKVIGEDNRDHSTFFENELERIGASSTETTQMVDGKQMFRYKYGCYECTICGNKHRTRDYLEERRLGEVGRRIRAYRCCNNQMKYTGVRHELEKFEGNDKLLKIRAAYDDSRVLMLN